MGGSGRVRGRPEVGEGKPRDRQRGMNGFSEIGVGGGKSGTGDREVREREAVERSEARQVHLMKALFIRFI